MNGERMRLKKAIVPPAWRRSGGMNPQADLIHATEDGEFELVYQPAIDLAGGRILGWEALVRWHHPLRGVVSPAEFIPAAEKTGAILTIGEWILNRACEDFAQVLSLGEAVAWVSVNVSTQELEQVDFADTVRHALSQSGVEPSSLVLEITEAAVVEGAGSIGDALVSLRGDGVRIALDDFGSVSSSLDHLEQLPVDILKIDRTVTTMSGAEQAGILEAIVALGKKLGLGMIAEGIEESTELERIRDFEGVAGQGYFLARPMSLDDARTFTFKSLPAR